MTCNINNMALPYRVERKKGDKIRPKSCEIVRTKSEWKNSFENRRSVFEQSPSQPLGYASRSTVIKKQIHSNDNMHIFKKQRNVCP